MSSKFNLVNSSAHPLTMPATHSRVMDKDQVEATLGKSALQYQAQGQEEVEAALAMA